MPSSPSLSSSTAPTPDPLRVLESLLNSAYAKAKVWGVAYLILQATLFVVGVVAIFVPRVSVSYP